MGYVRAKTYRLIFEDAEFDGLEVRSAAVDVATFLRVARLTGDGLVLSVANGDAIEETVAIVAEALIDWNLEDEHGQPVPCTPTGLAAQDKDFALAVVNAWIEAMAGVARPLGEPSTSGDRSLEASLPMAPPSPSLAS